jgi:hypothetical protein
MKVICFQKKFALRWLNSVQVRRRLYLLVKLSYIITPLDLFFYVNVYIKEMASTFSLEI